MNILTNVCLCIALSRESTEPNQMKFGTEIVYEPEKILIRNKSCKLYSVKSCMEGSSFLYLYFKGCQHKQNLFQICKKNLGGGGYKIWVENKAISMKIPKSLRSRGHSWCYNEPNTVFCKVSMPETYLPI